MKLTIEYITKKNRFWKQIEALAKEAFPPEDLVKMAQADNFDFLVLSEQDTFVGFVVVQTYGEIAYLFFLAIDSLHRSNGYGSRAIEAVKKLYPNKKQVVDFEMVDENAENYLQRKKRREFYLRNGYKETGLFLSYLGVDYEVMCMSDCFDQEEFKAMMQTIQVEGFDPTYFTK